MLRVCGLWRQSRHGIFMPVLKMENTKCAIGDLLAAPELAVQGSFTSATSTTSSYFSTRGIHADARTVLIVGLGNLDMKKSRHSVGMAVVDKLARELDMQWEKQKQFFGMLAEKILNFKEADLRVLLLKPRLPMNINGSSVCRVTRHFQIPPTQVYLIHDDLDVAVGKFTVKESGSARGHRGVKSVMDSLRSDVMPRVRVGIDRPAHKNDVANYVLQNFTSTEQDSINRLMPTLWDNLFIHIKKNVMQCSSDLTNHET